MSCWRFSLACATALCALTINAGPAQQAGSGESQQGLARPNSSKPSVRGSKRKGCSRQARSGVTSECRERAAIATNDAGFDPRPNVT